MHLILGLVDGDIILGVIVGDKILCTIYVYLLLSSAFNGNLFGTLDCAVFSRMIGLFYKG